MPYADPTIAGMVGRSMTGPALLLGRRTYEDFYAVWPNRTDNPHTNWLNETQKYVASTTLQEPLAWGNSTLLRGDALEAVANLREQVDEDRHVPTGRNRSRQFPAR